MHNIIPSMKVYCLIKTNVRLSKLKVIVMNGLHVHSFFLRNVNSVASFLFLPFKNGIYLDLINENFAYYSKNYKGTRVLLLTQRRMYNKSSIVLIILIQGKQCNQQVFKGSDFN